MTVIDGVVFVVVRVINRRKTSFSLTLDWSEIMGGYNTADTVVIDRRTK